MTTLSPLPKLQLFDNNGVPLAGGKLYTDAAGTTTPKATYTNADGNVANANPVVLDSAGRADVWLSGAYKMTLKDALDNTIWVVDNVTGLPTDLPLWLTVSGTDALFAEPQNAAVPSYSTNQTFFFIATATNTSAVTINISGLGAKAILKNGATALIAGDIMAGAVIQISYDGTQFQLVSTPAATYLNKALGGTVSGATTFSGATTLSAITNTGCKIRDTGGDNTLRFGPGVNYTADRVLTTVTDADTVLGGNNLGAPYGYCRGFTPPASSDITGNATTAAVNIAAGQATDSTNSKCLTGSTFSWAVSNGNAANGYQGGTTLPNSSTIHFYVIALAADTAWTATFASTSLTPTLPGSYTLYKRIFSLRTSGAGAPLAMSMTETDGGSVRCAYTALITDYSGTAVTTTASLLTVATPAGLKTAWMGYHGTTTANGTLLFTSPEDPDDAVSPGPGIPSSSSNTGGYPYVGTTTSVLLITNTSSQLRARCDTASGSVSTTVKTAGWIDYRK